MINQENSTKKDNLCTKIKGKKMLKNQKTVTLYK